MSIFKRQFKTRDYRSDCEVGFDKFDTETLTEKLVNKGLRITGADFTTFAMVREEPGTVARLAAVKIRFFLVGF